MPRFVVVLGALVAVLGVAVPVGASPGRSGTSTWGTSFLDVNHDGVRDSGDRDLASVLGPDGYEGPGGLVLEGNVLVGAGTWLGFYVTGDITVRGNLVARGPDTNLRFESIGGGTITIAAGVSIKGNGDLDFASTTARGGLAGAIHIGAARLSGRGDTQGLRFAASTITVASGARLSLTSSGYNQVSLYANTLDVAPGVSFTAPSHGGFTLYSHSDLTLTNTLLRAGYLDIQAQPGPGYPGAKHILVKDSTIAQTYRNGDLRILADEEPGTIVLDHTTVTWRQWSPPLINPTPTIVPSAA